MRVHLTTVAVAGLLAAHAASAQSPSQQSSAVTPVGVWRGTSVCLVRSSPCHDEIVVYRITQMKAADSLAMDARKISAVRVLDHDERAVTIEQIQKRVGEHFGLRAQDLKVRSNSKVIAFPRQVAMFLVKQLTSASLPEIGRQFGGKHHTTVLHSLRRVEERMGADAHFQQQIHTFLRSFC